MTQDPDTADDPATADARQQAADTAEAALEVLRDPESGRVTFAARDVDDDRKLTEWMTVDPEDVVDTSEMH